VNVLLVTPAQAQLHTGNRTTAERWARILRELENRVHIAHDWPAPNQREDDYNLMVALHARRSFPALERFHQAHPNVPVVVALTGTDVYQDIASSPEAKQSLAIASRLVVLQPQAIDAIPTDFRGRCRVIYQSAESATPDPPGPNVFRVCVLAHLRAVKDPLRAAFAVHDLPAGSRVQVAHAGGVLDSELAHDVEVEQRTNPRYRWLGDLPRKRALGLLAGSHLLALTSFLEGGANVVSEAIAAGVPILSTHIPGSVGILGADYPGYFPVGDTGTLRALIQRAEADTAFYAELKRRIRDLKPLVDPQRERQSWFALLGEQELFRTE
jgi:putative glycosyltransferase (TIGR04348 family)